ncbi:MAG: GreA/GreB family elongation factor, partial [Microbacterium sp.]|uniref:GreA/GreB family elongation factor n=1 Tax=Microbacterium sp. TaxID=51671 RepID=UPI001AD17779
PGTVVAATVAGGEEVFLLGSREIAANSELDVYSEASPLGAAILGLEEGQTTSYTAPNGRETSVEIVKVETYSGQ